MTSVPHLSRTPESEICLLNLCALNVCRVSNLSTLDRTLSVLHLGDLFHLSSFSLYFGPCVLSDLFTLTCHTPRLRVPPETLDQLSDSLNLLEHLQSDIPNIEAQFEPLHDQFNILRKYEVPISEEVEHQLECLQANWMAFQQCLIDSEGMLKKHKVQCSIV